MFLDVKKTSKHKNVEIYNAKHQTSITSFESIHELNESGYPNHLTMDLNMASFF